MAHNNVYRVGIPKSVTPNDRLFVYNMRNTLPETIHIQKSWFGWYLYIDNVRICNNRNDVIQQLNRLQKQKLASTSEFF